MEIASAIGLARSLVQYRLNLPKQRRLRHLYGQFVRPSDLAFDVGAHLGDRTWALRALGCRVVAVEPQPLPARFLHRLYGAAPDVALERCALGAEPGTAELLISRRHPTVSSLSAGWVEQARASDGFRRVSWDRRVPVQVETLDGLIARHGLPAFCKIDVEGFECAVLRGLSRPIPALSFEFLSARPDLTEDCLKEAARIAPYRCNIAYGESLRLALPDWPEIADFRAVLRTLPPEVVSGDIYLRLPRP
ncbi:FkbM family methyltransferase [Oceanibaculum indicum]|uniref:FkbM family methyltransferase n=1 Tax=Oceanibaculum indicum TaxID=526216 RepID=A0A420WSB2_9PROT|nr:FkbM family methyltransferase [Oceanibaculum indicum]RKQ73712.1 FkbM family methyltransferase [Oceanibaculum indicum]